MSIYDVTQDTLKILRCFNKWQNDKK